MEYVDSEFQLFSQTAAFNLNHQIDTGRKSVTKW